MRISHNLRWNRVFRVPAALCLGWLPSATLRDPALVAAEAQAVLCQLDAARRGE
jgi:hypothetical protein